MLTKCSCFKEVGFGRPVVVHLGVWSKEHGKYFSLVNKYSSVDAELNQKLKETGASPLFKKKKIVERKRRDDFGQPSSS